VKCLISANSPHVSSGYGVPIKYLIPYLKNEGHTVAVQAFYGVQGNTLNYGDVVLYPAQGKRYGLDCISAQAKHFGADLVITLMDNWVYPNDYNTLFDAPWLSWFPVDGEPAPEKSVKMAEAADYPAVFSRHGVQTMFSAGVEVEYLPYAVDCDIFKPGNRHEARRELGIPLDVYLVITVAANKGYPARKAWPELLLGFKAFSDMHPEAQLYLHTRMNPISDMGIIFGPLIKDIGLEGKVSFADQDAMAVGFKNEDLVTLYQAADVMLLPSMGEGFGLPIAEAQACGCPVITQSCSSMPELTINGISFKRGQKFWVPILNYWWHTPEVWRITDSLEKVFWRQDKVKAEKRDEAIRHFYNEYHWPNVFQRHWKPLLERIESELW